MSRVSYVVTSISCVVCDVSYLAVDETRDTRHETRATRYKRDIRQETCLVFRVSSVMSRLSQEAGRTHFLPPQCFVYRLPGSCRGRFLRKFLGERSGKRAPGSHASEIIVRPQHREQRPNSIQLAAWLCVCRLGCLSLLRRTKSARQVAKIERIEWSKWPFRTALGTPLAGSKSGPEGDVLFICPATFFPGSAARGQGPETRPSVIGACRRGPNSGPISQDSGGNPPNSTLLHGWLTPTT